MFVCFQWLVGVKKQLTTWCKSRAIKGSFFHAWTGSGLLHTPSPARNFAFLISALSIHCASFFPLVALKHEMMCVLNNGSDVIITCDLKIDHFEEVEDVLRSKSSDCNRGMLQMSVF